MMILELFAMFDTAKVEIKKEHQLFQEGQGQEGVLHEMANQLLLQ